MSKFGGRGKDRMDKCFGQRLPTKALSHPLHFLADVMLEAVPSPDSLSFGLPVQRLTLFALSCSPEEPPVLLQLSSENTCLIYNFLLLIIYLTLKFLLNTCI